MNLSVKEQQDPEQQESPTKQSPGRQAPQDRWFDEQLAQLFNSVVNEPMPADLADLVHKLKAQDGRN